MCQAMLVPALVRETVWHQLLGILDPLTDRDLEGEEWPAAATLEHLTTPGARGYRATKRSGQRAAANVEEPGRASRGTHRTRRAKGRMARRRKSRFGGRSSGS